MNWVLWGLLLFPMGMPVGLLVVDRIFGIPARRQWVLLGLPALGVFLGALGYALYTDKSTAQLVGWGALAGVLGTILLDAVRLLGVRFGAFPTDMPQLFGTIALGLAPRFQRNMMVEMVAMTAALPNVQRQRALDTRLKALARMPAARRELVMGNMMAGLARLPAEQRQTMLQTQMGVLATLPPEDRRSLMITMDTVMAEASDGAGRLPYGQPRGMPKIPMATFRRLAAIALPKTWAEAGVSRARVLVTGYAWHFMIGATSLGIPCSLIFGYGSASPGYAWGLAMGWGIFVWLAMMVLMPPMMPMIRFPKWFPGVPLVAHIAFAIPFALVAIYLVDKGAHLNSLLGALR